MIQNPQAVGQQTIASQWMLAKVSRPVRANGTRRRKRRAAAAAPRRRKRATAKRGRPARLVKGSAAAKRYMAKIRRKRRR